MSDDELRFDDGRDEELGRLLRPLVAAPGEDYWRMLERRIMQRVAEERGAWWTVLAAWMRPAAIAAALLLAAAGVALTRASEAEAAVAIAVLSDEPEVVLESSAHGTRTEPAATLHLVLDH
jgi:hypothetical protein